MPGLLWAVDMVDPTKPPLVLMTPQTLTMNQPLELTAIFIYPKYRFAIINGVIMKPGDKIGEFTITMINPYTVELTGPQGTQQLLQLVIPIKTPSEPGAKIGT